MSQASAQAPPKIGLGTRVLVRAVDEEGRQLMRTGVVRFEGPTQFSKGPWVGVELTCATGKNDGAVRGQRCDVGVWRRVKFLELRHRKTEAIPTVPRDITAVA